jgi:predicted phage tail component-like protein
MSYGFTFLGRHSSDLGTVALSVDRTVLPQKRVTEYEIPGRDGAISFADYTYANRAVVVTVNVVAHTLEVLRERARALAYWLSGSGPLIFDDEPDKAYIANVRSGIPIEQIVMTGRCDVEFVCQPFAEALDYDSVIATITESGQEIALNNLGTQRTPCRIVITNTGAGNILDIVLTRLSTG